MITEKGRPASGPNHKLPGQEFTGPLLAKSIDQGVCVCGMAGAPGAPGHSRCGDTFQDAATFADVPTVTPTARDTVTVAEQWLTMLYGQEPDGLIWIGGQADGFGGRTFTNPRAAALYAADLDARGGTGVYHRLSTLNPGVEAGRGKVEDSATVPGLAMDLDILGPNHKGNAYPPSEQALTELLAAAELPQPTAWINSGGGRYPYWLLADPASVRDDAARARVADLSRQLHEHVIAVAAGMGWKVDNTSDLARIYRLPGTTNRKTDPVQASVVDTSGPTYALVDLERAIGSVAARRRTKRVSSTAPDSMADLFSAPVYPQSERRLFTTQEAADFCRPAMDALRSARDGEINVRLNDAAKLLSHFTGVFWGEQEARYWLLDALGSTAYDGRTWRAEDTIDSAFRSSLGDWRAERRPEVPGQPGQVPGQPDPVRVNTLRERMRARLHTRDSLDTIEPPTPLIDGVLDKGTIALLSGKFGSYKSFTSIAWACCIATGTPWEGLEVVTPGPVLYVAAEGCSGLRSRIRAWEIGQYEGRRISPDRLAVYNGRVKLTDADEMTVLGEFITELRPVLVVIDTLHQCAPGTDENSSRDMGVVLGAVAELRERYGVTVLMDHHTGHSGERARGSSALEDDVDTSWVISLADPESRAAENQRTLKHRKAKDRELLADRPILLRSVPESGSAYVESGTVTPNALMPDGLVALKVIEWLDDLGVPVSAGRDACRTALKAGGHTVPRNDVLAEAVRRRKAEAWAGQG